MWIASNLSPLALPFLISPAIGIALTYIIVPGVRMVEPNNTGMCHIEYTATQDDCATACFDRPWCVNFVYDPCCADQPNQCRCVMCYKKPPLETNIASVQVWGHIQTSNLTLMRLQEESCLISSEGILPWTNISTNCLQAIDSIETTLSPCAVTAFRLVTIVDREMFHLAPVCPPDYVARGHVVCSSNEGVWKQQNTIACFPTRCIERSESGEFYYAGSVSVTRSGFPCAHWNVDGSWSNYYMDRDYIFDNYNIDEALNYCRTFLNDDYHYPWCYNADYSSGSVRWDGCEIPVCPDLY